VQCAAALPGPWAWFEFDGIVELRRPLPALLAPLREHMSGRRVGLIVCGANQDAQRFAQLLQRGQDVLNRS
jgi:hypothetical protein